MTLEETIKHLKDVWEYLSENQKEIINDYLIYCVYLYFLEEEIGNKM